MEAYLAHTINLSPSDIDTGQGIVRVEDVPALWDLARQGLR
jgi:simple sugar transport system substrate-binding protein